MASFHFVFPPDPLNQKAPDQFFSDQIKALRGVGITVSTAADIPEGATVVYRGWTLTPLEYQTFLDNVYMHHATPLVTMADYLLCHHLPNWYPYVSTLTAETVVFPEGYITKHADDVFTRLGWGSYFVKDYVKSAGIVSTPGELHEALVRLRSRNEHNDLVGGVCLRKVVNFVPGSERRFFMADGLALSDHPLAEADEPLEYWCAIQDIPDYIHSPFFSVDIARNADNGELEIVEIGDGQVSDIKPPHTPESFASMWA